MAMTKRELEEMKLLRTQLAAERAMHISPNFEPDLSAPENGGAETKGWTFNVYSKKVHRAVSRCVSHYVGAHEYPHRGSGAQGSISLYSTEALALRALRGELSRLYALDLALIDEFIAQREKEQTNDHH